MLQAGGGTSNKQTIMNERYRMILCTVKYKRKRGCFDVLVLGCKAGCRGFVGEGFDYSVGGSRTRLAGVRYGQLNNHPVWRQAFTN